MTKTTIGVEGMACSMCESHVNDAVRRSFAVKSVKASRKKRICTILSEEPLDEGALRAAIEGAGYSTAAYTSEPYEKRGLFS